MEAIRNPEGRRWRPSLSMVVLVAATVLFCLYSYSESQRQQAELARAIKASCAKEVPPVSDLCVRAKTLDAKPAH